NAKGLDFYSRLVDELKGAGIESFPTLYHWDLPQALQDKGGWQSRDTATAFADYAGYMAEKLSDRVHHFFTLNEIRNFTDTGYRGLEVKVGDGVVRLENAPGLKVAPAELNQIRAPRCARARAGCSGYPRPREERHPMRPGGCS